MSTSVFQILLFHLLPISHRRLWSAISPIAPSNSLILEHLVLEGAHYDDLTKDQEFTDWKDLEKSVQQFIAA